MKTKMMKLVVFLGILASCTSDFNENDTMVLFDSTSLKIQQETITADNSFYEGDVYRYYLNAEMARIAIEIKALQEIIDSGNHGDDVQKKLQLLLSERAALKAALRGIPGLLLRGFGPLPVPCPPKDNGKCKYVGTFFIVDSRVDIEGGIFLGPKEMGVFQIVEGAKDLPKGFTAYKIKTDHEEFDKDATIKILRSFKGTKLTVTAPLFLE